jgi:DNA-directed RNA polymerase sigma subunit (sigma70/sigma32)
VSRVTRSDVTDRNLLAAQAHSIPPLTEDETAGLLTEVRLQGRGPALDRLVEHQLAAILALAEARAGKGVEVGDLAQEGTIASVVAVIEYAGRGGAASGLDGFVAKLVSMQMDESIELAALERATAEAFVRDTELYEVAEIRMRNELGRTPTTVEMAARLGWPEERVVTVAGMLNEARSQYDSEIVQYLDDADEEDA